LLKNLLSANPSKSFPEAINFLQFPQNTKFIRMQQIHDSNLAEITNTTKTKSEIKSALMRVSLNQKHIVLTVKSADCLPILITGPNFIAAVPCWSQKHRKKTPL
jgi:copper oxidase (laccase) domain-containing protein